MKKKGIILAGVILIILIAGLTFYFINKKDNTNDKVDIDAPKSIEEILDISFDKVNKIRLFSGTYGRKVIIQNKDDMSELLGFFKKQKISKNPNQENAIGYTFALQLFIDDKDVGTFDCGGRGITVYKDNKRTSYICSIEMSNEEINAIENKFNLK